MSNSTNALLLYKKIEVLNREVHKQLHLRQADDCGFAADTHLVPLTVTEFFQAARHYPILFVGEGETMAPIALLGLKPGRNDFVDAQGRWERHAYIPAFVRRYPFVLAQKEMTTGFTVCFDSACSGWNSQDGSALFDADGGNTPYLDEIIRFLNGFTTEMERTRAFVAKLQELGLLADRSLQLGKPTGERFTLRDFKTVDEDKFNRLADKKASGLRKAGFLGPIYAHLMSLGGANKLFERHLAATLATH